MDFGTVITAMVTPFDQDQQINWPQVGKLIDYLIDEQQSDALVISGTTGESPTLTDEEKLQLFDFAVKHANGRCKIIAGTGSYDTKHSIHLSKQAEALGVDALLLVAPYYNRPNQEGLYQHFKSVAEAVSLPIMLYNVPSRAGVNILPETTLRLAQLPNIVASKEAISDLEQITAFIAKAPVDFKVYCGDDSGTLPMLSIGAHGIVSVASHVIGKQIKAMVHSYKNGEVDEAAKLHRDLFPFFKGMFYCPHAVPNPVAVKYALNYLGQNVGSVRLPLVDATEEEGRFIQALFQ